MSKSLKDQFLDWVERQEPGATFDPRSLDESDCGCAITRFVRLIHDDSSLYDYPAFRDWNSLHRGVGDALFEEPSTFSALASRLRGHDDG